MRSLSYLKLTHLWWINASSFSIKMMTNVSQNNLRLNILLRVSRSNILVFKLESL
jgi:hypothetical protein